MKMPRIVLAVVTIGWAALTARAQYTVTDLGTLPVGYLAKRYGRRTAYLIGAGFGALAGLTLALAAWLASFWLLCLGAGSPTSPIASLPPTPRAMNSSRGRFHGCWPAACSRACSAPSS